MNDRDATVLSGNKDPDVSREPLPDTLDEAVKEFLSRLALVRGKYGRHQLRQMGLTGWPKIGEDLDYLDALAGSAALGSLTVAQELLERADALEAQHKAGLRDYYYTKVAEELRKIAKKLSGGKALGDGRD